jgi:hypothetical protein
MANGAVPKLSHGEERSKAARLEPSGTTLVAILRDAALCAAPQDEGRM